MDCKERLEAYFREQGVEYQVQQHPPAYSSQEVAATERVTGWRFAKVVMDVAEGDLVMMVLAAPQEVDTNKVEYGLGGREFRLAKEEEFAYKFPDCEVGAMPPFGNLYGVPVYVDPKLAEDEAIVFEAGTHTETMSVKYADFQKLVKPSVLEMAGQPGGS